MWAFLLFSFFLNVKFTLPLLLPLLHTLLPALLPNLLVVLLPALVPNPLVLPLPSLPFLSSLSKGSAWPDLDLSLSLTEG